MAGAVSLQPEVLILDEPIAQLAPMHADKIYAVLRELNEKYGKTIIVIEHHTEYFVDFCKHVTLMKDGQIQWTLPTKEALCRVDELESCNIFPTQVTIVAHRMQQAGQFETGIPYRSVKGEPHVVFSNLNLEIYKGEKIAMIGSNGAGKSTLMKMLVGLLKPTAGDVLLNGKSIREQKPETLSRQISMVYQNPEDMFIKDSIGGDIAYAMEARGIPESKKRTAELLERFRLTEFRDWDGRLLSGGQMQRDSLAIGIGLNPGILLLDEPAANLDIATRKEIMRTLDDLKSITETVVIATHDLQLVCEWADRIAVLCNGQVVADGKRVEIFSNQEIVKTVGIRPPEIFSMGQALCPEALCYTIDEFMNCFEGRTTAYENT